MSSLKQKVIKGVFWAFLDKAGVTCIFFVIQIVLMRLLSPDDMGTISLLIIFVTISNVFVNSGLGQALVQKANVTEEDLNSVFYTNLALSTLIALTLFLCAPLIAEFYRDPVLARILRTSLICLFFYAIDGVQNAILNRKMLFNLGFRFTLIYVLVNGAVSISLALLGYGAWSLVFGLISGSFAATVVRCFFIGWRPRLCFSFKALSSLFSFGWKLFVSSLLDTISSYLTSMVIGRIYNKRELVFVEKGLSISKLIMDSINGTISTVAFPTFSKIQNDPSALKDAHMKFLKVSTFVVFPIMTILAVTSRPLINFLMGPQWENAVPFLRLGCFSFALWPFHTLNLQLLAAVGRSDIYMVLELIKKIMQILTLCITSHYGVWWMVAIPAFLLDPFALFLNSYPNRKMIHYGPLSQLKDVFPAIIGCALMAFGMISLRMDGMPNLVVIIVKSIVGVLIYVLYAYFARLSVVKLLLDTAKPLFNRYILRKESD